jgi:ribosomal protein S18 acetylase RimI-like enzyme
MELMKSPALEFENPPLQALTSTHRHFAMTRGLAYKYPAEVTPFAALRGYSQQALLDLAAIMLPGESSWIVAERSWTLEGLACKGPLAVKQMTYSPDKPLPTVSDAADGEIELLSCVNATEMVELTSIAFPGFFRARTCEMGSYYGIRQNGRLVAMGGERMAIDDSREISGLCTHPDFRGRGYAASLLVRLLRKHREAGLKSYLHVSATNTNAIALYERMGFDDRGEYPMYLATREE